MGELVRAESTWSEEPGAPDLGARCRAVLAVLPEGTVIAGITAARLHGLWLPPSAPDEPIEVILRGPGEIAHRISGSVRPQIRGRRRQLRPAEIAICSGIPVVCAPRAWVELAEQLSLPDLVAAGDSLLRGDTAMREVELFVADARRRRGVVAARNAVGLLNPRSRSRPESLLRVGLIAAGLPAPAVNTAIHDRHGQWLAEPDLHYPRARLALEYNGAEHAGIKRMRKDIARALDVARAEWLTLTFGADQVFRFLSDSVALVRTYLDLRDPGWRARLRANP